jgi:ferrous iron transport protein A
LILALTQLKSGQKGRIVQMQGGLGMVRHLESMGIRVGKKITKISAQFWRGPQVVRVDNTQLAIGFGMARRMLIEVEE